MTNLTAKYIAKMRIKSGSAISAGLLLFVILIASAALPDVPDWIRRLFSNTIFKIAYLTVILIMFNYCPLTALLIALIFIIITQSMNKYTINRNLETSHNIQETAKSIIQSVADTSSELVSDSGEIIKTIGQSVAHARNYIIHEDSFDNLKVVPINNITLKDQYVGPPHAQDFSDTVPAKNSYYDNSNPAPESQCAVQPQEQTCGSTEQFSDVNYVPIKDKYIGPPHAQDFSDTVPEKNSYYDNSNPAPESQSIGQPIIEKFTQEVNYSAIKDLYTGVPFIEQYPKYESRYNGKLVAPVPQPLDQESVYPRD